MLADSVTGYLYSYVVYDGTGRSLFETVNFLLRGLFDQWYKLYMDNFYNSVGLSEYLLEKGVHTTGTLRKNRGEPPSIR